MAPLVKIGRVVVDALVLTKEVMVAKASMNDIGKRTMVVR